MASARGDGGSLLSRRVCHATHAPPQQLVTEVHSKIALQNITEEAPTSEGCQFLGCLLFLTSMAEGLPVSMLPSAAVAGACSRVGDKGIPGALDAAMPALDTSDALFVHMPAECNSHPSSVI